MPKNGIFLVVILILFGSLLRIVASSNDLWLDEVWVINDIENGINSWNAIIKGAEGRDGSASLYTPIVDLLQGQRAELLRAPAVFSSIIFLILIYLFSIKDGPFVATLNLLFVSISFVLVLYGSEARGYSPMLLCALASCLTIESTCNQLSNRTIKLIAFWFISLLGFLFHFSFLNFYVALLLSDLFNCVALSKNISRKDRFNGRDFLLTHIPLIMVFVTFYFFVIRELPPGSGTLSSSMDVVIDTLNVSMGGPLLSIGFPIQSVFCLYSALLMVAILGLEVFLQLKDRDTRWLFYLTIIFIVPILIILFFQPRYLAVRYFLSSIVFAYLLLASFVVRVWRLSIIGKILAFSLTIGFMYGNFTYLNLLLNYGRGQYSIAINYISEATPPQSISTIGSDHDFRNGMMVNYYKRKSDKKNIEYIDNQLAQKSAPLWYLVHSQDIYKIALGQINIFGNTYTLEKTFPFAALSGWSWMLYKRDDKL